MRTNTQLHGDVVALLAPITRDHYSYTGTGRTLTRINEAGIDLHDGRIGQVALAPDGRTVAHYMGLVIHPRADRHQRITGGASSALFGFSLTVASGSRDGALWALDRVNAALARARPHASTGLVTPYLDQSHLIEDDDANPPRWYTPLRYSLTVH